MDRLQPIGVGRETICLLSFPLLLMLAFKICLSRNRRWDIRFSRLCMLWRCSLLHCLIFLALGTSISFVARSRHLKSVPAFPRTTRAKLRHTVVPLYSKHFAQFCMFCFLLTNLVHVPGVRGVPQLDDHEPYFPGSAISLGVGRIPNLHY
jgi:hypothetical protein